MPLIRAASLTVVPWRNGLGTSRTIAGAAGEDGELAWQIGVADLKADADFSNYPNCDRIFTPIAGTTPPALSFDGGPFESCPFLVPKPFAGEQRTVMRMAAPGQAFNVLVDRRHYRAEVSLPTLAAGETCASPDADVALIYSLGGGLISRRAEPGAWLGAGDAVCGPDTVAAVENGTRLILVSIRHR